jgi:gluconokinase
MIIIVFGLSASGKTYIGDILKTYFAFHHEDADEWLPSKMQDYVTQKKMFSLEMLDDYTKIIIEKIEHLSSIHDNLVISQALYRQHNREQIQEYFASTKKIHFLQTYADDNVIYQRLLERDDWVNPEYAKSMQVHFQPMQDTKIIINNDSGHECLILQLHEYIQETTPGGRHVNCVS